MNDIIFNKYTLTFTILTFILETITTLLIAGIFQPTHDQFVSSYYIPDLLISVSVSAGITYIIYFGVKQH